MGSSARSLSLAACPHLCSLLVISASSQYSANLQLFRVVFVVFYVVSLLCHVHFLGLIIEFCHRTNDNDTERIYLRSIKGDFEGD